MARRADTRDAVARRVVFAAHICDPDGHLIQLNYSIEQLGRDGRHPRPSIAKPRPDAVDAQTDTYVSPAFLGPLG